MSDTLVTLRHHFDEACSEHSVKAALVDRDGEWTVRFEGQEGASPELMASVFPAELESAGVPYESWRRRPELDASEAERVGRGLARAIARMRVLLIEHQSFITGGLPWVFPGGPDEMRRRGLAIYRFPRLGAVEVYADNDSIHIDVANSDHGETVSSGFYVPTLVRGDFTATIDYELIEWQPGEDAVSFALFAQDVPSEQRTYAMRRTARGRRHEVLANFSNRLLTEPLAREPEPRGRFRLRREGDAIECLHAFADDPDSFVSLGRQSGQTALDLLIGCKTWTSRLAGPLHARVERLSIDGRLSPEQLPEPIVQDDPRRLRSE